MNPYEPIETKPEAEREPLIDPHIWIWLFYLALGLVGGAVAGWIG